MKNELSNLLNILMTGEREDIRNAKRALEKIFHKNRSGFKQAAHVAIGKFGSFDNIKDVKNQAAFASGLYFFYLSMRDEYFWRLKDFTLHVIQHPNGLVRDAIRKTSDWLYVSLASRLHPFSDGLKLSEKHKYEQLLAIEQYNNYKKDIESLLDKYAVTAGENNVKYIGEMKPSVYKSLQYLWSDLTRGNFSDVLNANVPKKILDKRKEIEKELLRLLSSSRSPFTLEDIKQFIYEEEGTEGLMEVLRMVDNGAGADTLGQSLEIISDAWNYFPHRILDGLCPAEKMDEMPGHVCGHL